MNQLLCENTGKGNIYAINKTDIEIKSQDENKIVCVASVELINAFDQTDNKNVNLVAALFDNPINLAARIVVPLLEKPGMIANA